jgi:small subunit ribosomal protein S17
MPRKKKEDLEVEGNSAEASQEETSEATAVEAKADDNSEIAAEEKPKRVRKAKADDDTEAETTGTDETTEETSTIDNVFSAVSTAVSDVAEVVADGVSAVISAVTPEASATGTEKLQHSKRAEKIGIVQSDKMTNTVTVRVDRLVKHPIYRKYVKRRKKFMAHDEKGAAIGDKVRIVETRPLSAKKRWRVVEIIQKAER